MGFNFSAFGGKPEVVPDIPEANVDALVDKVRLQESGGNPNAVSRSGAMGAYQLMPAMAKAYNVNPFDESASRDVAKKELSKYLKKYNGDVKLALQAYNAGEPRVDASIRAKATLPKETVEYPSAVLSQKPMQQAAPAKSGFDFSSFKPIIDKEQATAPTTSPKPPMGIGDPEEIAGIHKEAKDIYEKLKGLFEGGESRKYSPERAGKEAAGGAIAGGLTGLAAPTALELAGKVVPGVAGKALQAAGAAWGEMGALQRTARGVAGGASSGVTKEIAESYGASPAEVMTAELVAGGGGEALASLPAKSAVYVGKLLGSAAVGSPSGTSGAILGLMGPNRMAFKKSAENEMAKQFGKKIPTYTEGVVGSTNKLAAKEELMNADKSLPQSIVSLDKPVSSVYRDKLLGTQVPGQPQGVLAGSEVSNLIMSGKKFSTSPQFKDLNNHLQTLVESKIISPKQKSDLINTLAVDRSNNPIVINRYPSTVDNAIREWGKQGAAGPQEGYKAVSENIAKEVRDKLRTSYNGWMDENGLGKLEAKYRNAYKVEKQAEAKDDIAHLLHYGKPDELDAINGVIAQDKDAKTALLQEMRTYLGNTKVEDIASNYNRIDKLLVGNRVISAEDILPIRNAVQKVISTAEHGERIKAAQRVQRMLIRALPYQVGTINRSGNRLPQDTGKD